MLVLVGRFLILLHILKVYSYPLHFINQVNDLFVVNIGSNLGAGIIDCELHFGNSGYGVEIGYLISSPVGGIL